MNYKEDYLDDVLIRRAYHSSGIEGNTISLPETVSIILESTLPSSRKSIREFYEIENHKQAFAYLMDALTKEGDFYLGQVETLHALLVDRLQHAPGHFKQQQNTIIGAEFKTASPEETPYLMRQWAENLLYRLEQAQEKTEILTILAESHIAFE